MKMKRNADRITMEELEAESYNLFTHFNSLYFDGALEFCVLKWSSNKSLHRSTGTCNYVSPGECEIFLSKPLLRSCSINDLKNSLLHQMIHAFLWVKYKNKNLSDHSLNFQNMINTINSSSVDDHQRPCSGYNVPLDHKIGSLSNYMSSKTYSHVQWMCDTCGLRIRKSTAPSDNDCVSKMGPAVPCNNPKCKWHNHKSKCAGTFTVTELQAYKANKVNLDKVVASNCTQDHNDKKINSEKTVVSDAASVQDRTVKRNQAKIVLFLPSAYTTEICKGPRTRHTKRREIYKNDLQQRSKNVVHQDEDGEKCGSIRPLTNKRMKLMQMEDEKMRKEEENEDGSDERNECDTGKLRTRKLKAPSDKDHVSKVGNNQKCMWHNHKSKCTRTSTVAQLQTYKAKKVNSDEDVASNGTQDGNAKKIDSEKTVISDAASLQDREVSRNQGKTVLLFPFANTTKICKGPRTRRIKRTEIYMNSLQQRSKNVVHEDEEEDESIPLLTNKRTEWRKKMKQRSKNVGAEDEEEEESVPPLTNKRTERRKKMKLMQMAMKEAYEKMKKEEENDDGSDEGNECDTCGLRTKTSGASSDEDSVSTVGRAISCNDQKCMWFNYKSKRAETFTVAELQAKKGNSDEVVASNGTENFIAKKMNPGKTVVSNAAWIQDGTVKHNQKMEISMEISKKDLQLRSKNAVHEDEEEEEEEEEDESIQPLVNKRTERRKRMKMMQIAMKEAYEKMRKEEENEDGSDEGNEAGGT